MKLRDLLIQVRQIEREINSSPVYICGGAARDRYMGRLNKINDLDLTTGDKTIDLVSIKIYEKLKDTYRLTRHVMPDGHSSIFMGNLKIDFSSNYNAPEIDIILNRRGISKPTNLQKETFSRDFTCNSLLMDFNLNTLMDPTKMGFKDIKDKKIRTCLSPEITLQNNSKRIIRSIYLASKLNFDVDINIINFVKSNPKIFIPETSTIVSEKLVYPKYFSHFLSKAFDADPDKASYLLGAMNLWQFIPVNERLYPYYLRFLRGSNVKK